MIEKFACYDDNFPAHVFIDEAHDIGAIVFDGSVNFVCNYITDETFAGALELSEAIGIGRKFVEEVTGYCITCADMSFSAECSIPIYREGLEPMEAYILPCEEALRNMHYASIKILG